MFHLQQLSRTSYRQGSDKSTGSSPFIDSWCRACCWWTVHRRTFPKARPVRAGQQRNDLAGRNRRDASGGSGAASEGNPASGDRTAGQHRTDSCGHQDHRRHEPEPSLTSAYREISRRSFFRLNVFPIDVPPLRERVSDIPALVQYFIARKAKDLKIGDPPLLAEGAIDTLMAYDWPGNVRELENVIERTMILHRDGRLRFDDLGASLSGRKEKTNDGKQSCGVLLPIVDGQAESQFIPY